MPGGKVVTTYNLIQKLKQEQLFGVLVTSGVISKQYVNYVYVYESYLACSSSDKGKLSCYEETAAIVHLSSERVRKIVALMETPNEWLESQPIKN
jgi:hypothetical protein